MTNWYSGSPICTPSRATLMTGRLAVRTGMTNKYGGVSPCDAESGLPFNETTLAEHLRTVGYKSAIIGKWHLGQRTQFLPTKRGFDYYFGVPFSVDMGSVDGGKCPDPDCTNLPLLENENVYQQPANLSTLSSKYAQRATQFIEENQKGPFLLYMAFSHVHVTVPPIKQYAGPDFAGKSIRGKFGDAVEEMDWVTGEIMNKIRDLGLSNNTIVFFTSDNGPWMEERIYGGSEGPFTGLYAINFNYTDTGKASTWEGGVREPALVWWPPYISAGAISHEIVSTMDIFTTSLKLAGVPVPTDRVIDGEDILPVLINDAPTPHDFYFIYRGAVLFAVRHGPYKAHFKTKSGFGNDPVREHNPPLLFNVDVDPAEMFPLPPDQYQDLINAIQAAVNEHNKHVVPGKDQISAHNPKYAICCNPNNGCVCGQELG